MKIVVTGASGFVGQQIVPVLASAGAELRLVGRSVAGLEALFPRCDCFSYDSLGDALSGSDMVVHLAVLNNDQKGTRDAFMQVNVAFTLKVLNAAREAGAGKFVAISSAQTLEQGRSDSYVDSKRAMEEALAGETGIEVSILHLPKVYGAQFNGKLALLNRFPPFAGKAAFLCLAALKPTLHADRLARHILQGAPSAVLSDGQSDNPVFHLAKRSMDLAFALGVIVFLWWLLALIWLAVKLTSPGPGIFAQERLGQEEEPFVLYKFRTMNQGTKQAGTHEVTAASVTRIGKTLRAFKLDELPQVWNILLGQISLIGPRPGLPGQQELRMARRQRRVFQVRPGISGLSQVEGIEMSTPERLAKRDAEYIALQGLVSELRIAIATVTGSGGGDHVKSE